jgi:hypothetical protein
MGLAKSMASVSYQEAEEIFKYLPGYGNFLGPRILADLIRKGGGKQVRRYLFIKEKLRQFVKNCLYKKTDNAIAALGRFSNQLSGE